MTEKVKEEFILPNNLKKQFFLHQSEYEERALEVLRSGWYVLGNQVTTFEEEWATYVGAKHCVGLASGLDALWISMRLLGIDEKDEVIVSANAYIACVMGITMNGGTPVFVEPDKYGNIDASKIEEAITDRTKAILAVHLYGQSCDMDEIMRIARAHNLRVVEDCAQSHGSYWKDTMTGTVGDVGCFSFYPSKNCGAFGDGGCIVTDDDELARQARIFRNYGSGKRYHNEVVGANSRLDELQAGLLRVKLAHLDELNSERVSIAERYLNEINNPHIELPEVRPGADSVWHQFVIRCKNRDELQKHLEDRNIGSLIHYPIPPHLSQAYKYLGHREGDYPFTEMLANEVLSIPIYNGMSEDEQKRVIEALNSF